MDKVSFQISARIVILFTIMILWSFIPEYLHTFFNDTYCEGSKFVSDFNGGYHYEGCLIRHFEGEHPPQWHWGYRHYLFMFMGLSLTIVQIVYLLQFIDKKTRK